jgi:hypothetical protein
VDADAMRQKYFGGPVAAADAAQAGQAAASPAEAGGAADSPDEAADDVIVPLVPAKATDDLADQEVRTKVAVISSTTKKIIGYQG